MLGLTAAPGGKLYAQLKVQLGNNRLACFDDKGKETALAEGLNNPFMAATRGGHVSTHGEDGLVRYGPDGRKPVLSGLPPAAAALALAPDAGALAVSSLTQPSVWAYRVEADDKLTRPERAYTLREGQGGRGAGALLFDADGRLYAATREGVQVFDAAWKLRPAPGGKEKAASGGDNP